MITLLVALLATSALLVMLLRIRHRLPVDRPNERSLHSVPTPRIGGLAVVPSIGLATCVDTAAWQSTTLFLLLAAAGMFMVSLTDDQRGLSVSKRLGAHMLIAAALAYWLCGPSWPMPLVALGIVWSANLYNFMDGANGLAGGMAAIGFAALAIAGAPSMAWAVSGAALAFLMFNFDPARVFLGDSGSVPIGLLAGSLGVLGVTHHDWPLWFPLLVFSPFVLDASLTLLRRLVAGQVVWHAHREHYYQRLIRMGWSHRRLALAEYALMVAVSGSALYMLSLRSALQWCGVAFWCCAYLTITVMIDRRWQRYPA